MNVDIIRRAYQVPGLPPPARLLLAVLADHANARGLAWPSRDLLVAETGMSDQTIKRHMTTMEELAYLTRANHAHPGQVLEVQLHPDRWPRFERPTRRRVSRDPPGASAPGG